NMSRLQGGEVDGNLHYIDPRFQFKNRGSTNAFGNSPPPYSNFAAPATTGNYDDGGQSAVVPTFFISQRVNEQWSTGLGINLPYGLATDYSKNWVGRYNALESDVKTININPAVSYRFNEQFSIGAGFNAMYGDARLTNALDFGSVAFLRSGGRFGRPSSRQYDGLSKLTVDGWGYGWNAGLLYEPLPGTRFGVAYRSKVNLEGDGDFRIRGNSSFATAPGALRTLAASQKLGANVKLNLPATLMLGAAHELTDRWTIMAGTTWTNWNDFDEIRVNYEHGARPDTVQPENWQNTWRTAIGTSYKLTDEWTLRGGFEFDPTPARTKYRTPRVPDEDRYWFVVGFGYEPTKTFGIDFAYTYLFTPSYNINDTEVNTGNATGLPIGNTVKGKYEADSSILSLQGTWRF
ncbi:MAG TPA: outer membrane protein transport protein, partial [Candidatus Competibacteraceae bacterium]|nr:outer membrane protein transport protein [Candidatus Competibacteraceae bacterium]